jgi:predicted transport protein
MKQHWKEVREQAHDYAADLNLTVNPLRKDTIEFVKEAANWGRLGVQYALIGNGGALAGLPYLLGLIKATAEKPVLLTGDVIWSAGWFAAGMFAAAATCVVAYVDFTLNATINWSWIDLEVKLARQRHYDVEVEDDEFLLRQQIFAQLKASSVVTSLAGIWLALLAWVALAWGAIRLISSLQA